MELKLPPGERLYAIGDIHGMLDPLLDLLGLIDEHEANAGPAERVSEIFLGDYVDRGADSHEVIELLRQPPQNGRRRVCLKGNHEAAMLAAPHDPAAFARWLTFGGDATCRGYGIDVDRHAHNPAALQPLLLAALPETHGNFLNNLALTEKCGDVLFVHAGIRPGVAVEDQTEEDLIWIRDPFLYFTGPLPAHVVHGHTPSRWPERRIHRTNVDTGAVYGGALTAAVLEGDTVEFLSVPTHEMAPRRRR
ncbi:MAG: metallophosphoesterase family protein [Pseudomonadota bacterium]